MTRAEPMTEKCRLCGEVKQLMESHILSKLVFRRLKRMPGTSDRLISGKDTIVQDGPARRLLCSSCEEALGEWERQFNEHFLTPYYRTENLTVAYGPWLGKFVAANLWRSLVVMLEDAGIPASAQIAASSAARAWRGYLRDGGACAPYDLHIIPMDNRAEWFAYSEGVVAFGGAFNPYGTEAYLIAKLTGMVLVGVLRELEHRWVGTLIDPVAGVFDGRIVFGWPALVQKYLGEHIARANAEVKLEQAEVHEAASDIGAAR